MAEGSVTTTKTASWGISTIRGQTAVAGVVTDYDDAEEPILAPEHNEVGTVINQTQYDRHFTCSFTVQVASGTAKPLGGAAITIATKTWYVTSARITESNSAYRKIAISAERYALCTETELASGVTSGT